jgi:hypothetical protein
VARALAALALLLALSGAPAARAAEPDAATRTSAPAPSAAPGSGAAAAPFVPLLAPDLGEQGFTSARNLLQGSVTAFQAAQVATDGRTLDYLLSRVRTSGGLERIDGTPWALEWSAALSYRDGEGLARSRDHEQLRAEVFRLSLFRRFDDRSMVRLGRFIPRELPAVGLVDGAHGEVCVEERLRLGAVLGWKPTVDRLRPTLDTPLAAAYATANLGAADAVRWTATLGLLGALHEGRPDRAAVFLDQRLRAGALDVLSSSEVDLDVDRDDRRAGTRLTRWNLLASWDAAPALRLSAGVDRFEVPDTGAEREAAEPGFLEEDELFADRGWWRLFGRATLRLPGAVTLGGELSYTDDDEEDAWRGAVRATLGGLGESGGGSVTLSVYDLRADEARGAGARLSALLPLGRGGVVALEPALSARWTRHSTEGARFFDEADEQVWALDASLRARWRISRAWSLAGGVSYARTRDDERVLLDAGITWWW